MSIYLTEMLRKIHIFFVSLCLLGTNVQALNYPYPVFPSKYLASATSPAANKTEAGPARSPDKLIPSPGLPFTIFYQQAFPQRRGGKNLNVTLVSENSPGQARIMNRPNLYPVFLPTFNKAPAPINASPPQQKYTKVTLSDPKFVRYTPTTDRQASPYPPLQKYVRGPLPDPKNVRFIASTERPAIPPPNLQKYVRGPLPDPKTVRYVPPTDQQAVNPPSLQQKFPTPRDSKNVRVDPVRYTPPTDRPDNSVGDFVAKNKSPETDIKKQTKAIIYPYSFPQKSFYIPSAGDYGDDSDRFRVPVTEQTTPNSWPCFCVPYYLCKNGFINSGGRSVSALSRKARSYSLTNETSVRPKVMSAAYVLERESDDPSQCGASKVCCQMSFSDGYYPVATPPPYPARIPEPQCGVRQAYGIQPRLTPVQYPTDVAEFGEYPWQAAVLRRVEGQKSLYLCGGVLLSPNWVATAAHCIKKEQNSPLLIRLGEWDVNRKDEVYPFVEVAVDSVVLNPDFDPDTLNNDLALLRMKVPVDERYPHVTPACLPRPETVYDEGSCWVSGWGKDFFGPQGEYQNILKEVDVPVLSREACDAALAGTDLGPNFSLHPGFLCAGGEAGKDACTGDGGSPLVCSSDQTWYVVGLVSWGIGCGQAGVPGIYVNMLYYNDWINSIVWR